METVFRNMDGEVSKFLDVLEAEARNAVDTLAEAKSLVVKNGKIVTSNDARPFEFSDWSYRQLAGRLGIPWPYAKMIRNIPDLMDTNFNWWLSHSDRTFLIRTTGEEVRAFLTPRYKIINNVDVAKAAVAAMSSKLIPCALEHAYVTSSHMEMVFLDKHDTICLPGAVDDKFFTGIALRNSEVGAAALRVDPYFYRQICSNGMFSEAADENEGIKRIHLGVKDDSSIYWTDRRSASAEKIVSEIENVVNRAVTSSKSVDVLNTLASLKSKKVTPDETGAILSSLENELSMNEAEVREMSRILSTKEEEMSYFGILQAVTRMAHMYDTKNVVRRTYLEAVVGEFVSAPNSFIELCENAIRAMAETKK